jgi:hypothetical protein
MSKRMQDDPLPFTFSRETHEKVLFFLLRKVNTGSSIIPAWEGGSHGCRYLKVVIPVMEIAFKGPSANHFMSQNRCAPSSTELHDTGNSRQGGHHVPTRPVRVENKGEIKTMRADPPDQRKNGLVFSLTPPFPVNLKNLIHMGIIMKDASVRTIRENSDPGSRIRMTESP